MIKDSSNKFVAVTWLTVKSASLLTFQQRLNMYLFRVSYYSLTF